MSTTGRALGRHRPVVAVSSQSNPPPARHREWSLSSAGGRAHQSSPCWWLSSNPPISSNKAPIWPREAIWISRCNSSFLIWRLSSLQLEDPTITRPAMTKSGTSYYPPTKPAAKSAPAKAAAKAKGRGKGQKPRRARNGRPRRRPAPGQVRPRGKGKGARLTGFRGSLRHVLNLMYKPLPTPVRTRLEVFRFRAKFPLMTQSGSSAPATSYPLLLFRPDRTLTSTFIWGGRTSTATAVSGDFSSPFSAITVSQTSDATASPNWTGANDGAGGFIYDNGGKRSEAVPTPNTVLSSRTRPCYGVCRIRITAGPTVRGSLVYRVLNGIDGRSGTTPASLYADMDSELGNRTIPLRPGTHHYDFVCPVETPTQALVFQDMWASPGLDVSWLTPVAFSFRDVTWNFMTDTFPEVEYSTIHAIQCELTTAHSHFSNVNPSENNTAIRQEALEALGGGGLITGIAVKASRSGLLAEAGGAIAEVLEMAMMAA